jgi:uncharacterized protein YpiB (UPF0302 family)
MSKPVVKIQVPAEYSAEDVIKALQATVHQMKKDSPTEHDHENNVMEMSKQNLASKQLLATFDQAYDKMTSSLFTEIKKVFDAS